MGIKLVWLRYLRVPVGTSARVVRFAEKGAVWRTVCHDLAKDLPPRGQPARSRAEAVNGDTHVHREPTMPRRIAISLDHDLPARARPLSPDDLSKACGGCGNYMDACTTVRGDEKGTCCSRRCRTLFGSTYKYCYEAI